MTRDQAQAYCDEVAEDWHAQPCVHGHYGCATREGGPCSNELAHTHNLYDEEEF